MDPIYFLLRLSALTGCLLFALSFQAQPREAHYEEDRVPEYVLPPVLTSEDPAAWPDRRQELLRLFEEHMYGRVPGTADSMTATLLRSDTALAGRALMEQYRVLLHVGRRQHPVNLLLYLPVRRVPPYPVFVAMNFYGNHAIRIDTNILLPTGWFPNSKEYGITDNRATDASRGARAFRWSPELVIDRGYALATFYRGDFDPDRPDHWSDGVHPLFYTAGQTRPDSTEWGSIAAWAWGYSRITDHLLTDARIDPERIIFQGHSRLGKAALWAGANDERAAVVVSNNSGCGGAALSRRGYGETVSIINTSFPHWFNDRFPTYNDREAELPVDQHQFVALMAPRPVYVASAVDDRWADPRGEYLAAYHAGAAYRLLGLAALPSPELPPLNTPLHRSAVGYHLRSGGHDVRPYDWERYLDFADYHLGRSN